MRSRRRNAPSVPASLHRPASASNRRFSLPENWRRLAIATTSGSRRAASGETVSPVALRAPSATASPEDPVNSFKEDFSDEVMFMSYLYSKLPETGVPHRIGTGGGEPGLRIDVVHLAAGHNRPNSRKATEQLAKAFDPAAFASKLAFTDEVAELGISHAAPNGLHPRKGLFSNPQ